VLQRRPNTFAQTILSFSFFACDKAADHTFLFVARLDRKRLGQDTFPSKRSSIRGVSDQG
jgi:hypothetical protein